MYKFTEFPPVPGSVAPAETFNTSRREFGSYGLGMILGTLVAANAAPGAAQEVCEAFISNHIGNPAMAEKFREGALDGIKAEMAPQQKEGR